jgi:hypothetical protein
VTIPHWNERVQEIAEFAKFEMVAFVPFVASNIKESWEQYANERLFSQSPLEAESTFHQEKNTIDQPTVFNDYHTATVETQTPHHVPTVDVNDDGVTTRRIFPCDHTTNETRMGFVDDDMFMERILSSRGYKPYNLTAPIYQYAPSTSVSSSFSGFVADSPTSPCNCFGLSNSFHFLSHTLTFIHTYAIVILAQHTNRRKSWR